MQFYFIYSGDSNSVQTGVLLALSAVALLLLVAVLVWLLLKLRKSRNLVGMQPKQVVLNSHSNHQAVTGQQGSKFTVRVEIDNCGQLLFIILFIFLTVASSLKLMNF